MKLDHIAMYVLDLEMVKEFFITYFGATANEMYHNPRTGLRTYFLTFPDGGRLEIMSRPEVARRTKELTEAGYIHLAFSTGSREMVSKLTEQLQQAGFPVLSGPRLTGDGYYESCILGPENNQIEITE